MIAILFSPYDFNWLIIGWHFSSWGMQVVVIKLKFVQNGTNVGLVISNWIQIWMYGLKVKLIQKYIYLHLLCSFHSYM